MNESLMIEDIKNGATSTIMILLCKWENHYHKFELSPALFSASIFPVAHIPEVRGDLSVFRVTASQ